MDLSRAQELLELMLNAPLARTLVLLEAGLVMMDIPMMAPSFEEGFVVTDTMTELPLFLACLEGLLPNLLLREGWLTFTTFLHVLSHAMLLDDVRYR